MLLLPLLLLPLACLAFEEPVFDMASFEPTYQNHLINTTEWEWVAHCIAQWCELDGFLNARTGKIKCSTDTSRPQGGISMFICNAGNRARCSRSLVQNAMITLWGKADSMSGAMIISMSDPADLAKGWLVKFKLGWDWACSSSECGPSVRDPMRDHCDADPSTDQWRGTPPQMDRTIGIQDFGTRPQVKPIRYMGVKTIKSKPAPTWRKLVYPTITPKFVDPSEYSEYYDDEEYDNIVPEDED
ncbi:hypothetical protein OQA88_1312 [Cercophora sp. LCS_1]